jgi:hypothetical protein
METSWGRAKGVLGALARSPFLLFLALSLFLLVVHEPWRDEAQPWLIVRDAPTVFSEMDSEGTPALWYVLQLPLVKLGLPFLSARILHVAFAAAALAVFLLHAPFRWPVKWLLPFGYYVAYEYNAITRSYVLVFLLLVLLATFHRERFARPLRHGLLLLLLANVTAHGTLLAVVLGAEWGLSALLQRRVTWQVAAGGALAVAGAGLAVLQVLPAPDIASWRTWTNDEWAQRHFVEAARGVLHAFAPYPPGDWWWGGMHLDGPEFDDKRLGLGIAAYLAATAAFLHRPRVLLVWTAGSLALLGVYYLKTGVSGQLRHHGLLFLFLLYCLWVARLDAGPTPPRAWRRLGSVALVAMLVIHVTATVPAVAHDAREDFSGGPGAAAFLRGKGWTETDTLLAVYPSFIAAPALVHLDGAFTKAYVPQTDSYQSYIRWTHEDAAGFGMGVDEIIRRAEAEAARTGAARVVLLLSFPMGGPGFDGRYELGFHSGSISPGDGAYVYSAPCPCGDPQGGTS